MNISALQLKDRQPGPRTVDELSVVTPPQSSLSARTALARLVERGRRTATTTLARIMDPVPDDALVRADALQFDVIGGREVVAKAGRVRWRLHTNARDQLCTRVGVPVTYARALLEGEDEHEWRRRLLEQVLREHASHQDGRFLFRSVGGQARAVLSDRYRRLDSRPLLLAFIESCTQQGGVAYEAIAGELSSSVRVIIPRVIEPVPGEAMVFGVSWSNSDFGTRAYAISTFILRLVCLNGAVGSNRLKQIHLGARLPEHLHLSERTYELDTQTMVSATRDIVQTSLGNDAMDAQCAMIRRAHETEVDWTSAWRRVSRELGKLEQGAVKSAFDGPDVIHLPPGRTAWRFSNAISWVAGQTSDDERRLELQRLAGAVLPEAP